MSEQHFIKKSKYNKLNQSIYHARAREDGIDETDGSQDELVYERERYLELILENIGYDYLVTQYSGDKWQIDELVSIMLDVICSQKETIRVNREEMPQEVVKAQFLKLDGEHIRDVLSGLKKNNGINNPRAYLITALYNLAQTVNNSAAAQYYNDVKEGKF